MKTISIYIATFTFIIFNIKSFAANPNLNISEGVIYQLAINSNDIHKANSIINEYKAPNKLIIGAKEKFQFGKYKTYQIADSIRAVLVIKGCANVTVFAYNNRIMIPVSEAIAIQYKDDMLAFNKTVKRDHTNISIKEVKYLLQVKKSGLKHYYSLAVPVNTPITADLLLDKINQEEILEINIDDKIYSIGHYNSFEDAVEARKDFIKNNINDVFIMAQFTDNRINTDDALQLSKDVEPVVTALAIK